MTSSPRRALASCSPRRRALSRCSSASLMAPLRPSTSRSLNEQGSYRPSSFRIRVPVGVVAGQSGDFQAEHDAGPSHADVGDQPLEAVAALGGGARASQVLVDHDHLLGRPAQCDRPLAQRVLAVGGGGVLDHLPQGGLAHIQVGGPAQVLCGHLGGGIGCHQLAPLSSVCWHCSNPMAMAASTTTTAGDAAAGGWGARVAAGGGGGMACHAAIQAASPRAITNPNPSAWPPAPPASATDRS